MQGLVSLSRCAHMIPGSNRSPPVIASLSVFLAHGLQDHGSPSHTPPSTPQEHICSLLTTHLPSVCFRKEFFPPQHLICLVFHLSFSTTSSSYFQQENFPWIQLVRDNSINRGHYKGNQKYYRWKFNQSSGESYFKSEQEVRKFQEVILRCV